MKITGDSIVTDSTKQLEAMPHDELLNDSNWINEEKEGDATNTSVPTQPVPTKHKKRQKSGAKGEAATSASQTTRGQNSPMNEVPTFDPTSMRPNYKEAFVGGVEKGRKQVKKGKSSKIMRSGKRSPTKSVSTSVLPRSKMITFSRLQQLRKHWQLETITCMVLVHLLWHR